MSTAVAERTLRLLAVPAPGDTATYFRLHEMRQAAYALNKAIDLYLATPALPACAGYRQERLTRVEADIDDMRKALGNG